MLLSVTEWWSRLVARRQTKPVPTSTPKNEIEELIEKWLAISPDGLNGVFSSDMSIFTGYLRKNNVREYVKYLDMVNEHFEKEVDLKPVVTALTRNKIFLNEFFISEKGFFLDPVEEFSKLREKVVTFLQHYENARKNVEKSFEVQRNLSLTNELVAELTHLADVLQL